LLFKKDISKLQVVILAGGLGTRLMEETQLVPKPLVTIGKIPIILHLIKHYQYYGLKNFIICLGYKGEMIVDYFEKNKQKELSIKFIKTGLKSLTATRVNKIKKYIIGDFFLTYGDGLSDVDIKKTYKKFKEKNKIGLVTAVNPEERYGIMELDYNSSVLKFSEKPHNDSHWINGGFFIFKKEFFKYLKAKNNQMLERKPLQDLTKDKELIAYKHSGFWKAMDTLRDKLELEKIWKTKNAKWKKNI